ncbi:hypothetical protein M758_11G121100 [Ceratodon purpureus]|nr:hypothetical protein M758_11G121100 [Ceratodon purpureus]
MYMRKMSKNAHVQDEETVNGSGDQSGHSQSPASVKAESEKYSAGTSSPHQQESNKYDIFINHRGPDTKLNFVTFLEDDLKEKHYSPFVDMSLKEGEATFEEIKKAIQTTRVHLAIFSPGYAESKFCLEELVDMLECREKNPETVTFIPCFFDVKPKDLRNTHIYRAPFHDAFQRHEDNVNYSDELISKWKKALEKAADFKGFEHSSRLGDANMLKKKIVARVQETIPPRIGPVWRQGDQQQGKLVDRLFKESSGDNVATLGRSQSHSHPERGGNEDDLTRKVKSDIIDPRVVDVQQGPPEIHQPEEENDSQSENAPNDLQPEQQAQINASDTGGQPENDNTVTFESGDRPLRILVLGKSDSVEQVVSHICGADRRQTQVQDYESLTESRSSSPPMCLYYSCTQGSARNDFTDYILRTFVRDKNERWQQKNVKVLFLDEVYHRRPPGERHVLLPDGALRLHMVWYVCREQSDLPHGIDWNKITKNLHDLPIQILVPLDSANVVEYKSITDQRIRLFQNARENAQNLDEMIVKFDLSDENLKENLWRICWEVKTRVEIGIVARIIADIRKEIGLTGIPVPQGVGGAVIRREVSLMLSGRFVLNFLCKYWGVPDSNSIADVLLETTTFVQLAPGNRYRYSIRAGEFVKFCLQVAAIILFNARDEDRNLRYVFNWPDRSSESFQFLKTETEECYECHFPREGTGLSYYDKMKFEDIRVFLQNIFERKNNFGIMESIDRPGDRARTGPDRTGLSCWSCLIL